MDSSLKLPILLTNLNWHSDYSLMPGISPKALSLLKVNCSEMVERSVLRVNPRRDVDKEGIIIENK